MQRDRAPFDLPFPNQWLPDLPGFRETLVEYLEKNFTQYGKFEHD